MRSVLWWAGRKGGRGRGRALTLALVGGQAGTCQGVTALRGMVLVLPAKVLVLAQVAHLAGHGGIDALIQVKVAGRQGGVAGAVCRADEAASGAADAAARVTGVVRAVLFCGRPASRRVCLALAAKGLADRHVVERAADAAAKVLCVNTCSSWRKHGREVAAW